MKFREIGFECNNSISISKTPANRVLFYQVWANWRVNPITKIDDLKIISFSAPKNRRDDFGNPKSGLRNPAKASLINTSFRKFYRLSL